MFTTLTIKNIIKETPSSVSIEFDIPAEKSSDFSFKPGQFLTLKTEINGEEIRRSYSICTTPKSGVVKVVVKEIPNGKFSSFANHSLKVGDSIEVGAPAGNFFIETNSSNQKQYTLVAAGSGITPIISILKTILEEEPSSKINLFYGNKSPEHTIFKSELDQLANQYADRLNINLIFSQTKGESRFHSGRIEGRRLKKIFSKYAPIEDTDGVFMCGPQEMVEAIKERLEKKHKYPTNQIHFELFTATKKNEVKSKSSGNVAVNAILDGNNIEFEVTKAESLLEAALKAGYDVPFSCQGGVCGACKCIVIEGDTEMDMNLALSEDEVASGYSLACQTKIKSDKAKVSFDF